LTKFDTNPSAPEYPGKLREIRVALGYSQRRFAELGGYSSIMQGRYETDRSKANSAIPSERTAKAIKQVVELALSGHGTDAPTAKPAPSINASSVQQRTLKAVATSEIEQAISSAIGELIGAVCKVTVNNMDWSSTDAADAAISFSVIRPEELST
jgi:transcriptional regulator with XRE-family HTH domain